MKVNWDEKIKEAESLPAGNELWVGHKYQLILICREKLDSLRLMFWRGKEKLFYKTMLKRLTSPKSEGKQPNP
jgi:hypothetical protein